MRRFRSTGNFRICSVTTAGRTIVLAKNWFLSLEKRKRRNTMKKLLLTVVALMMSGTVSFARPKTSRTYTGEIMDSTCAKMGNHDAGYKLTNTNTAKDCTVACSKTGAKFVLYNATRKVTYEIDDQDKARGFAGQKVKVIGAYDATDKTIHVEKIEASS
jgi:hypothetical protein